MFKVLVVNLGATSTKVSIFEDENEVKEKVIRHTKEEMDNADTNKLQVELRGSMIKKWMDEDNVSLEEIDAIGMRGAGMTKATVSGTYQMNDLMRQDAYKLYDKDGSYIHGSRMVLPMLDMLLEGRDIPIYVTDPPYVDEFCPEAKITGHPMFERLSRYQVLNHKQVGRQMAEELGKPYEECNIIIAHMGGGVSVGAHRKGSVIDCNDCTDGDGPFSPERSGSVPVGQLIKVCFSGKYTQKEVEKMIRGKSGVMAYLGVSDMRIAEQMAEDGNELADLVLNAFTYQVSKEIGACYAALKCNVDAIVLTGGIAYSERIVEGIKEHTKRMANIYLFPGEEEGVALVRGALSILRKENDPIAYI